MSTHKELAGRLTPGDLGWTKVRIDTAGQDGWCFCTPANHPEDVALGKVEGEWAEESQFFGLVVPLDTLSPPDEAGLTLETKPQQWSVWAATGNTIAGSCARDIITLHAALIANAAALAAEKARADGLTLALVEATQGRDAAEARCDTLAGALRDAKDNGLIYWEPNTQRGHVAKAQMIARLAALLSPATDKGGE